MIGVNLMMIDCRKSATPRLKAGAWDKAQALTDYPER